MCSLCNKTFSHPTSLRNHSAVHTKLRPFICSFCGQAFSFHGNLKVHLLSHSGEKVPSPSSKIFIRKVHFIRPLLNSPFHAKFAENHSRGQPISRNTSRFIRYGDQCCVILPRLPSNKIFIKTFQGEKTHKCPICLKSFTNSSTFSKHKKIHSGEKVSEFLTIVIRNICILIITAPPLFGV